MFCDGLDIVHHSRNIRKYHVILPLEDVVGSISLCPDDIGVIYEAFSQRLDFGNRALKLEP